MLQWQTWLIIALWIAFFALIVWLVSHKMRLPDGPAKQMPIEKTNTEGGNALGCLFLLLVVGAIGLYLAWHEQEGVIKTDDCRAHVQLDGPSDPRAWLHKFTCELGTDPNTNRKIGECSAVELDQGSCTEHLYYFKK